MLFSTIVCSNHLALASILGESIKQLMPGSKFIVCLLEKELPSTINSYHSSFDEVVLANDIGIERFNQTIFKYNQYEASGSCKGQLFRYAYQKYPKENSFVYLDADTQVFSPFFEVSEALKSYSIVLTPHLLYPSGNGSINDELAIMSTGIFNTGFLAIKRSKYAKEFIDWWSDRLRQFCYTDPARGLFNEQKWVDLVPVFFDQVHTLKHPGYNVANWNLFERNIAKQDNMYLVNGVPLRFFHFSGVKKISKILHKLNSETTLYGMEIVRHYKQMLKQNGHHKQIKIKWSYDYFDNDKPISNRDRRIFQLNSKAQEEISDPYNESKRTFYKYRPDS
ncbi:glycosyltransferase [Alkalihalobacillus sp. AL-G]|uniref:glycosyltransferase n=1 Tax=Alkalihalobacillus sp. AL-G TaxID=2926399 RepID=UPI00272C5178|nr:glycosyltransferase [Alkalihalobacillus sp. AL-G]WLD94964.1 glycosyltransferase [Alkalihalobacillus sp. AL-G]